MAVDADNAVAGHHSHSLCGAAGNNLDDTHRVIVYLELYTHAAEVAFEFVRPGILFFKRNVRRVRIQIGQYRRQRPLYKAVEVDTIHVLTVDDAEEFLQFGFTGGQCGRLIYKPSQP